MKTDLLIIGAGPAGMSAAETARLMEIDVIVVDEQAAKGGQFLRQPPSSFKLTDWLPGKTYHKAKKLLARSEELTDIMWLMRATVSGIFPIDNTQPDGPRFRIVIDSEDGSQECHARCVLIAGGCYDLPVIFPGWTTPGVMAAGGIQAFIKSQQLVPGQRFVLAGSHPLQLVIADQLIQAGGKVAAVLFAQSQSMALSLIRQPLTLLRQANKFSQTAGILKRLRKADVPIHFNRAVVQANGTGQLHGVSTARVNKQGVIEKDTLQEIECDRLGVCFSFLSSTELVRQVNADCTWNARRGGWIAQHDRWMCSSIPGIYVAGETTGVAGSDAAMEEGKLAALGCALDLGKLQPAVAEQQARAICRELRHLNAFAELLSRLSWPGDTFFDQLMSNTSIVCKCEELSVGDLLKLLQDNPATGSASSAKLLSRAGMGLCQGRYCHHAVTRVLAQTHGLEEQVVAGFTSRFPTKPVLINDLVKLHGRSDH